MVEQKQTDEGTFSPRDTGRSRGGSLAVLFGFLGILAVAGTLYLRPVPDETLVVVAVTGCSEPCRENLALSLAFVLETQGFQVHERGGEEAETLDALDAIAEEHHAVHRLLFEVVELQTEADSTFVEVRGAVRSANEDAVTHSIQIALEAVQEERVETEPLRDEDAVRIEAGLMAIDAISPDLVSALLSSDVITRYLEAEPRDTSTAITRHTDLTQAAEDDDARLMNAGSFNAACDEVGEEYDAAGDGARAIACFTPTCEQEHLVAVGVDSLVVQRDSRFPVFPLRAQHDVLTAPTPHRVLSRSEAGGEDDEQVRSRAIFGYSNAAGSDLAFISASDAAYSLFVTGESSSLALAERPSILSNAKLEVDWVLFERRPFRGADPVLMVVPRSNDEATHAFEVTPFGVQGDWIELSLGQERGNERVTYVATWVAGIRQETRAALEAQGNGERLNEAEAIDDLDDDLDAERLARVAAGLPPLDHIALVSVGDGGAQVVQRLGGRTFPLSYAQATPSGALVLIRAAGGVCELLRLEPQDWSTLDLLIHEESWVRLASCPAFPVVSEHVVYGTERVSGEGDPSEGDMEIVRFDMRTGARSQLTFNAIEERYVRLYEGDGFTRVGFERVPAPRFARFRPSGVCVFQEDQVQPAPVEAESAAEGASLPTL